MKCRFRSRPTGRFRFRFRFRFRLKLGSASDSEADPASDPDQDQYGRACQPRKAVGVVPPSLLSGLCTDLVELREDADEEKLLVIM